MKDFWVIAYDVSDDRARYEVADMLKNHGSRVQYSVFECYVTGTQLQILRNRISRLLDSDDSVRWYPLCRWCRKDISWQGSGEIENDPEFFEI